MMTYQKRKDQVVVVRFLIKRLLEYGRKRKLIKESSTKEMAEYEKELRAPEIKGKDILGEEVKVAIHIPECIYDLDWPENELEAPK